MKKWGLRCFLLVAWFFGPISLLERWEIQDKIWMQWLRLKPLEELYNYYLPNGSSNIIEIAGAMIGFSFWVLTFFWILKETRKV